MIGAGIIQSGSGGADPAGLQSEIRQQMDRFLDLLKAGAPESDIAAQRSKIAELIGPKQFELLRQVPHFMLKVAKQLNAANVYQQVRIQGQPIEDRREKPKGDPEAAKAKSEAETAKPKKTAALEKKGKAEGENTEGVAGRSVRGTEQKGGTTLEQQVVQQRMERFWSNFEKLLAQRFREGIEIAKSQPEGRLNLGEKTLQQFRDFFAALQDRTIARFIKLVQVNWFLFRGMVPKGNRAVVISDMMLANGKLEKFVRFLVQANGMEQLKGLKPGDQFSKMLAGFTGEELAYLALRASNRSEFQTSQQPTQGKFMGGQVEARTASELGIALEGQLDEKGRLLRKRSGMFGFGGFGSEEYVPEGDSYQFIPWWHWGNLNHPGRWRWTTIAFYLSLLAIALLGIGVMTSRLL